MLWTVSEGLPQFVEVSLQSQNSHFTGHVLDVFPERKSIEVGPEIASSEHQRLPLGPREYDRHHL